MKSGEKRLSRASTGSGSFNSSRWAALEGMDEQEEGTPPDEA